MQFKYSSLAICNWILPFYTVTFSCKVHWMWIESPLVCVKMPIYIISGYRCKITFSIPQWRNEKEGPRLGQRFPLRHAGLRVCSGWTFEKASCVSWGPKWPSCPLKILPAVSAAAENQGGVISKAAERILPTLSPLSRWGKCWYPRRSHGNPWWDGIHELDSVIICRENAMLKTFWSNPNTTQIFQTDIFAGDVSSGRQPFIPPPPTVAHSVAVIAY